MGELKIAIIGTGNLGTAIARGIVKSRLAPASSIVLTRRQPAKLDQFKFDGFGVEADNKAAVKTSTTIILVVQPKQLEGVLKEIAPALTDKHILVSTVTGITTDEILSHVGKKVPVI